jgi:hypothetical protein
MRALALALEVLLNCSSTETKYSLAVKGLLSASFSGISSFIADVIVLPSTLLLFIKAAGLSTHKTWSISRTPRQISICSFQVEKLVPFNSVIPEI